MKIVSFFESIKIGGGVEKVQANISKGLVTLGYDFIHLVLEDKIPRNEYDGKIISLNEKFIFGFGIKKILLLFKLSYKVAKFCKKEQVDVILGQGDFFYMIVSISKILFGNKAKCIGVVHTTIGIWPKYIKIILIFLLKKLNKVILISQEEYQIFIKNYSFEPEKLEVIYNTISQKEIQKKLSEKLEQKYSYLFCNNNFTFINIGRLTYQKNQKLLLETFDNFYKKNNNSQLIILGNGELKNELFHFKNSLISKDNIYFLGNQENVFPFLKNSDCFVLSSRFEGFGLVLIEAMISGIPIISTNCPTGPREILQADNNIAFPQITQNAIIINNENKKELYDAMEEMYHNKEVRIFFGNSNKQRGRDFGTKKIIKKWDLLFQSI